ncbi:MAG: hypothetical protein HS104_26960 [Polyangiaceae bacterium]|nr:hypothetical protein [Polyangiaceae bacterium]
MQDLLSRFAEAPTSAARLAALDELVKAKALQNAAKRPEFVLGLDQLEASALHGDGQDRLAAVAALLKIGKIIASRKAKQFPPLVSNDVAARIRRATVDPLPHLLSGLTADDREYLLTALAFSDSSWAEPYLARSAVEEESGENARVAALQSLLARAERFDAALELLADAFADWEPGTEDAERSRTVRLRRILDGLASAIPDSQALPTYQAGKALSALLRPRKTAAGASVIDDKIARELADAVFAVVHAMIARDFSIALEAATYEAILRLRRSFPEYAWTRLVPSIRAAPQVRSDLVTALTILAKQGTADDALFDCLAATTGSVESARRECITIADRHPAVAAAVQAWLRDTPAASPSSEGRAALFVQQRNDDETLARVLLDASLVSEAEQAIRERVLAELQILSPTLVRPMESYRASVSRLVDEVERLGRRRQLRLVGQRNGVEEYSPARHMLGDEAKVARMVRVVEPGVERIRDDGVAVVVVRAIVEPFSTGALREP